MLLFVYNTTGKRFVIFTCRYFKLSWNTTALSQSNCRNFSRSSIIRHYVPSGWRVLSVTHNPTNMMFHWGVLTVLCFSFLWTLITDILFTECREEPWCNFDIFSLRSAWAIARCHMLKSGRKFRDCGRERSRQLFWWCCVSSRTEYFCWWW